MNPLADLPTWATIILGLLAAVILVALNIGWLLSAKAMLDAQRRKREAGTRGQGPGASGRDPGA